ncbi:hypothetical protein INT46_005969 [Mucor plumbeus]|uniref:Uncharacterized protein n=1 Tax=Mucor plumbeus TaxID=97098 RepID=A0A8H7QQQ6_9FUNG|nr:hypothetical protein INT46_005969 [Mucor plumbeus]
MAEKVLKLYSRDRFKKALEKRLGGKKITGNTDIFMYMNFLIFLEKLAEASEESVDAQQSKKIRAADVDINLEKTLRKFRG